MRAAAAASLTNIGQDERDRRKTVGGVILTATAAAALYMLVSHAPPATRLAVAFPLWLGSGFYLSGVYGL